jgi:2,3-bisphosphoglycerate-independent phosphoglycerate mutase
MTTSTLVVMMCGAADRPIAQLNGKTPLEAARTPVLDDLTRRGAMASVTVIDAKTPPESDSGAMALLGLDPRIHYTGRGPLEAYGLGFWRPGASNVGFRINFGSVGRDGRLDRRTARDLTDEELRQFADSLRTQFEEAPLHPEVDMHLHAFGRHRGVLCLTSDTIPLSGEVSNTDPGFVRDGPFGVPVNDYDAALPCMPLDDSEGAANTAKLVNDFVNRAGQLLDRHPVNAARVRRGALVANVILVRDGGSALPSREVRTGHAELAMFGQIPAERALIELYGGTFEDGRQQEGESTDAYYQALAERIAERDAALTIVHVKGPDEPGHDNDPLRKVQEIEAIDRSFMATVSRFDWETFVAVVDHSTPCEVGLHVADPIPLLVVSPKVTPDLTTSFTEAQARAGSLGVTHLCELLPMLGGSGLDPAA